MGILTSAEITIVMTYFQLCAEDWRWWWKSVWAAGSSALYLLAYSVLYFYTKLDIEGHFVSSLLYFGYMLLVSTAFFLVTGTIGFYATNHFEFNICCVVHKRLKKYDIPNDTLFVCLISCDSVL